VAFFIFMYRAVGLLMKLFLRRTLVHLEVDGAFTEAKNGVEDGIRMPLVRRP